MSELEQTLNFAELGEEGLDIEAIFGSGSTPAPPPPPEPEPVQEPGSAPQSDPPAEQPPVEQPSAQNTQNADEGGGLDLLTALAAESGVETPSAKPTQEVPKQVSLFDKAPVFSYGGVRESIEDTAMTFEELRIAKADDFPELAEGKKVSWSVEYGKTTKYISDPKGTTIASVKEEIEKSKAFLDGLKKAKEKDRNPDCLVKPKVTAQSKGTAAYKGVFPSVESAKASDKVICLFPGQDGHVYELRKTEMGDFIAPKHNIVEFSSVRAGFTPALPLIPKELMGRIISFFRCFMNESEEFEALVHIYWDREQEEFTLFVPRQRVSKVSIDADLRGDALPEDRYLHYADVHSHNSMEAKFSPIDDRDEKATRLYFVIGHLERYYPSITARFSCGGTYQEIDPALVLESIGEDFPCEWLDRVERGSDGEKHSWLWRKGHMLDNLLRGMPEALLA